VQKILDVVRGDPLWPVLVGQHLPVEQRDGDQVGQRVVCLLLGLDLVLRAFLAAADDVERGALGGQAADTLSGRTSSCTRSGGDSSSKG
jgi:hypothetical protein